MMLSLGACAYGAARILERQLAGWLTLAAGLGLAYMVRPHVAAVVLAALCVAMLFRRRPGRAPIFGPVGRIFIVTLLAIGLTFVLSRAIDQLLPTGSEASSITEGVGEVLDRAETGTDEGGSEIDRPSSGNPLEYPGAVFTVLFRPTLVEADTAGDLVAAVETTFLLGLLVASRRRILTGFRLAFRQPYVLFCLIYTAIFALAWSAFANLGAIARQRVQVWPFILILVAVPVALGKQRSTASIHSQS
jgi:hypothetical protein